MTQKTLIISFLIGLVLLICVGGGAVYYFYKFSPKKDNIQKEIVSQNPFDQESPTQKLAQTLSSNVIVSVVAFGKVSAISGANVTLTNRGDSMIILFPDSAVITYGTNAQDVKQISSKEIKVGDEINVNLIISSGGAIHATSAYDSGPELIPAQ